MLKTLKKYGGISWLVALSACTQAPLPERDVYKPNGQLKPTQHPYEIKDKYYYPQSHYDYEETGVASWYGPGFHGRHTSTGAIFDENKLTAAHNTLPLPCVIRVTNLDNQRTLDLEVNDRGPFAHDRVLDVSRRAAQLLGFIQQGTAHVNIKCLPEESRALNNHYRLHPPAKKALKQKSKALPKKETPKVTLNPTFHFNKEQFKDKMKGKILMVQVGIYPKQEQARRVVKKFSKLGKPVITQGKKDKKTYYRVLFGPINTVQQAESMIKQLSTLGEADARIVMKDQQKIAK